MANALTLRVQKADAVACVIRTTFALTLCVQKRNALTLVVRKADTVSCVVQTTFALTLCVQKRNARHPSSGRQMPWHASSGRHLP